MRSSAIYNYTKTYKASESTSFQHKPARNGRSYFLCPLPKSTAQMTLGGNAYRVVEPHLSIYDQYDDKKHGIEAYHLTINLKRNSQDFVVHCYYDISGNARGVHSDVKLTPEDNKALDHYRQQTVDKIQNLNQELMQRQTAIATAIEEQEKKAEELSQDLKTNIKKYIKEIRKLIKLIEELNLISHNSQADKKKILEQMLRSCEQRLAANKSTESQKPKETVKSPEAKAADPATPKPEPKEKKQEEPETLDSVNKKLLATLKGNDLATLKERKRLLEIKLKLTPQADFDSIILIYKKLQKLCDDIPKRTLELALAGNVDAAKECVANNYHVRIPKAFLDLVHEGKEEVFDILFPNYYYGIFLTRGSFYYFLDSKYGHVNLLSMAYAMGNINFFRKLAKIHHINPNIVDENGRTLIYLVVSEGEMEYAKILQEAGANLNARPEKPKFLAALLDPSDLDEQKQALKNTLAIQAQCNPTDTTLLVEAARFHQDEMLQWLAKFNIDTTFTAEQGLNALGIYLAKKGSTIVPATVLALLEAGMDIDVINQVPAGDTCNPLHYRCQWTDEAAVRLMVSQFAADPNVAVKKRVSSTNLLDLDCLTVLSTKFFDSKESAQQATRIMLFLLNQDIRPLSRKALETCSAIMTANFNARDLPFSFNLSLEQQLMRKLAARVAVVSNDYGKYFQIMKEMIDTCQSPIYQAIEMQSLKLDLIEAAVNHLDNHEYQDCLNACHIIFRARFATEQYNETLWETCYQAHLGLGDDENACKALERYLNILTDKSVQVLAPKYKKEIDTKIEKASVLLTEVQLRLLEKPVMVSAATLPFAAEMKKRNQEKLAGNAVAATVLKCNRSC